MIFQGSYTLLVKRANFAFKPRILGENSEYFMRTICIYYRVFSRDIAGNECRRERSEQQQSRERKKINAGARTRAVREYTAEAKRRS